MKKKNLLLSIFFSLLLIFSAHTFNSNKTASAAIDQDIVYTVSTADGNIMSLQQQVLTIIQM